MRLSAHRRAPAQNARGSVAGGPGHGRISIASPKLKNLYRSRIASS
jgi:hypothetical protein